MRNKERLSPQAVATLLFMALAFAVILPDAARAHAYPDHADPRVGSTVTASPERVRVWFDSALEPAFSSIMVHAADGAMVDKRDGRVDQSDPTLLEVSVPPFPRGSTGFIGASWRGTAIEPRAIIHSRSNEAVGGTQMNLFIHSIPNWLELTFLAFSVGILISLLWVLPPHDSSGSDGHEHLRSRMWLFLTVSVFAMLTCSVFDLMMRSAEMSGEPVTEVFPEIPTVISRTHYGSIWLIRTAVLVLTFVLLIAGRRRRESRGFLLFLFALASAVALTESASGHAADKGDFSVVELVDVLHLLAASVWGGGLFTLSLTILPQLLNDNDQEALAGSASRFSRIAGIAVGVIVPTALYNAWIYVGSIDALVKSSYGWTIIVKILLLLLLLYLGAFNRYITVPFMRKAAGLAEDRPGIIAPVLASRIKTREKRTAKGFSRSVRAEAFLMIGMFLCAALLRHEVPAKHYLHQHEKGVLHPHMH